MTMKSIKVTAIAAAAGFLYTQAKGPGHAATPHALMKEGRSTCQSILGMIAMGDCSISTAAKNGGITKVASVDYDVSNILGIIAKTTVIVSGE